MARKSNEQTGKTKKKKKSLADKADRFLCYQKSVQAPDHEVEFFERAYRDVFRKKPLSLREDFCGTFAVCCDWVASDAKRTAVAVDLCEETLQWGRDHNLSPLTEDQQSRVRILMQDVRKRNRPQVDILAAQNFSFWIFKTRKEVVEYFRTARANLAADGIMVTDMMGGGECSVENHVDKRVIKKGKKGFSYRWTQARFDPVTHDCEFHIGFKFADGSRMKKAFVYQWRFWSIPEVREMMAEAGFTDSWVYWDMEEDEDKDSQWTRVDSTASAPSWICYVVAQK